MLGLIGTGITVAAVILGYVSVRNFVRTRLRFVDGVQRRWVPWATGFGAAVVASPVAAVLPLIGVGTALLFGVSVGVGVANGARDIRRDSAGLLNP